MKNHLVHRRRFIQRLGGSDLSRSVGEHGRRRWIPLCGARRRAVLPGVFGRRQGTAPGAAGRRADWCGRKDRGFPTQAQLHLRDFFVAPDESYIVIYSTLPDNLGNGDLYISFRQPDGTWTEPRNLGPDVNTKGYDFAPSLSPDGQYLFFTRDEGGTGNVHWISTATFRSSDS